jgi:transcriptional regulator with PAS, ATPase and Fis domain
VAISEASSILIEGENGTGKDLIAKSMHYQSLRQSEPFLAINCAAIPETLLESELFGYEEGAFTDARAQKRGLFELAGKGTLLLDEIGEMPLSLQAKLLRVLEAQCFRRLGGCATSPRISGLSRPRIRIYERRLGSCAMPSNAP